MKTVIVGGALALLTFLALRGRRQSSTSPAQEPGPFPEPWQDDPIDEGGPMVGEFWRWPNEPLPLIKRDASRRLMGVYSSTGSRQLMAVVDSSVLDSKGQYLVISTTAMTDFPAHFPTAPTRLPAVVVGG